MPASAGVSWCLKLTFCAARVHFPGWSRKIDLSRSLTLVTSEPPGFPMYNAPHLHVLLDQPQEAEDFLGLKADY
jgi:hypothetical protein